MLFLRFTIDKTNQSHLFLIIDEFYNFFSQGQKGELKEFGIQEKLLNILQWSQLSMKR